MKSIIKEPSKKTVGEMEFPCLLRQKADHNLIVLFEDLCNGTVVAGKTGFGRHFKSIDINNYEYLPENVEVSLSNDE